MSKSEQPRLRFSLTTLFLAMTATALALGSGVGTHGDSMIVIMAVVLLLIPSVLVVFFVAAAILYLGFLVLQLLANFGRHLAAGR